jgi:2-polyprenyl-3-methyl-5-hydroxy-6-metoxy-1,4-benzoquinol methylase
VDVLDRISAQNMTIPLTGEKWAAASEAYAICIAEHLTPETRWLDAGAGSRILESDMDSLEDWLVQHSGMTVGMDLRIATHRNIRTLACGSVYELPFADGSFNLVTCNVVMEHLGEPEKALAEVARVLVPGGALVINTPNLLNYGVMANALLSKVLPEQWRLKLVRTTDGRHEEDFFPVRYRANTLRRLNALFNATGFTVHTAIILPQQRTFFRKTAPVEKVLMRMGQGIKLLVCAHKHRGASFQ